MKTCIACSMPLEKPEDFGCQNESSDTCVYCTNEDGTIKSCIEIFDGWVNFFMAATWSSRQLAEKIVRKNMLSLPYWQERKEVCLEWEIATDEEFSECLKKLGH